ncbi:capsular biosynthesis protein CpsB, partial [Thermodesulfobacteriota bacterium]
MMSNRNMKKLGFIYLMLIIFLVCPLSVYAAGKLTVKPKLSASWKSDDNFYKAENVEREVYTYLIQPGIQIGYQSPKSLITFDYTLDSHNYDDQDPVPTGEQSADNGDYTGHKALFNLKTKPTSRFTFGLQNNYIGSRDPGNSDAFNNSVDRDKYAINTFTPSVLYDLGSKFAAGLRFRYTDTDYDKTTREDSTEIRPIFDLVYNFNKTTSLDLEWQYWERDYDLTTSDYESVQTKLILKKKYKYFSLEAGAGYHYRDFEDPTLEGIDLFTYRFALIGQGHAVAGGIPKSNIAIVAESNLNDSGSADAYFVATKFTVTAGRVFMSKIPVTLSGKYQNSDYERTIGLMPANTLAIRDDDLYA